MVDTSLSLLLIDDDPVDVSALRRALRRRQTQFEMHDASDGRRALKWLRDHCDRQGSGVAARGPVLILDLDMPQMDGLEFLQHLRADPRLRDAVVFVFSSSDLEADVRSAYGLQVAGYVLKSVEQDGFGRLAELLEAYSRHVRLPLSG
jgi:CheY-like chemotaxis protein